MNIDPILLQGDCLELMGDIPDGSVHAIICDLPYGTINWKSPHAWDNIIPFKPMWEHYWRVLAPQGAVVLFGNEPFSTLLKMSQLQYFKYDWIWEKSIAGGFANAKVKPLKTYELISVFSRGTTSPGRDRNMPYYPQDLVRIDRTVSNGGKSRMGFTVRDNNKSSYQQEFTNYPKDILRFANETGLHPTQKPVPLIEYLIKTYTLEDETVLDNTAGSMTTAIAAMNAGRKAICMEKDSAMFAKGSNRVANHRSELAWMRGEQIG